MALPCPEIRQGCKYAGTPECLVTRHHQFWPSPDYTTKLERDFRNLPENIEPLSRCDHDVLHATTEPPMKPDREVMVASLVASGIHLSRRALKEIRR